VTAVQAFGDFQNFHPHLHSIATDGCFYWEPFPIHYPSRILLRADDLYPGR
jgi:hypothetical protein